MSVVLACTTLVAVTGTTFATRETVSRTVDCVSVDVTLDGAPVELKDVNGDPVQPFTIDGNTYLPVRAISEALGLEVEWDQENGKVILTTPKETELEKADLSQVPDGFRVVTVGSGAPGFSATRANPATLVQYKDKNFLVDCGYGSCQNLFEYGLPVNKITNMIFTHQHEDHNGDFGQFFMAGWFEAMDGRTSLNLVGPQVQMLYDNTYEIFEDDIEGRLEVGHTAISYDGIRDNVTLRELAEDSCTFEMDGVTIRAMKVIHGNMQAYAYRFEADGQSVVVTGDLAYTEDLEEFLKDADVVVIDAFMFSGFGGMMPPEMLAQMAGNTHIRAVEMEQVVVDANVGKLILTHIKGDPTDMEQTTAAFREKGYQGDVIAAYDGLAVTL